MNSRFRLAITILLITLFVVLTGRVIKPVNAQAGATPILVVYNDTTQYKFGRYLGEILRAEGLNSFDLVNLSSITSVSTLTPYKVVVLAETPLSAAQAGYFTSYVGGGGYLIAMRPDAQIKNLFGLNTASGTQTDGYLKMSGTGPSQGLNTSTLQIHGTTDRYSTSAGAIILAQLYSNATTATAFPAVVSDSTGRGVAFLYDLARNIVYTRQGNPANANPNLIDIDGDNVLRTIDLFQTSGGGTPWVDLNKVPIPQADEQQRLFARLVQQAISASQPMPQLWYFPGIAKTMLIPTSDAHANNLSYYQAVVDALNTYNGDGTIYLSVGGDSLRGQIENWIADGHSFGLHPGVQQPPLTTPSQLQADYTTVNNFFTSEYQTPPFSVPRSRTARNHQVAWVGWTDAADIAVSFNMGMDANFYQWGEWLQKPDTSWAHGYITGSGQPMKFMKADGTILNYYQQLTQLVDEQFFPITGSGWEGLTIPQALDVSKSLIDASLAGDYAAIMTQFHIDYTIFGEVEGWVTGTLDYANSKGVPIWNADEWLTFTETRQNATYTNIAWNAGTKELTFSLDAANQPNLSLSTMLPLNFGGEPLLSVTVDSVWTPYTQQTIKGVNVAFVSVPAGDHSFVVRYGTPPPPPTSVPSGAPLPYYWQSTLSAPLTWNRVTWATEYQVQVAPNSAFTIPLTLPMDGVVPASTLSLTVTLPQEGTYYWRVRAGHPQLGWRAWSAAQRFTIEVP